MAYAIKFTPSAASQFRGLRKYVQVRVRDAMLRHLVDRPERETKSKKRLNSELIATYELRVGDFRVFYDIAPESEQVVVEAVSVKRHHRLFIAGEEVEL